MKRRALLLAGLGWPAWRKAFADTVVGRSKIITLVVAAPPGGPSDDLARLLAAGLQEVLGQPVIVENRPGAGGAVAAEWVARATSDGSTLMLSWIGNATSQALMPRLRIDINRQFTHITQLVNGFNVLIVDAALKFASLHDLIEHARAHPGALSYASSGTGSSGHLAMEMLKQRAGISMVHVPYRGGGPAITDLLSGQVQLMFINQDAALPYLQSDRVSLLAITSSHRVPALSQVPTVAESGYPGFLATAWAGLSAPAGTPAAVVDALYHATLEACGDEFRQRQAAIGAEAVLSTPAQYTAFVRKETDRWGQLIRKLGIQAGR